MSLAISTPTDVPELESLFGIEEEDDQIHPIGRTPRGVQDRLDELTEFFEEEPDVTLTLARDWERTIFGLFTENGSFDVLCFTEDGRIGYGGVNLPVFYDTVEEYLEAE